MNRPFARRSTAPRLSPEEAERQGRASRLVFEALREPAAVIAFLNTHHATLGGRPLDIAIASAEGLAALERTLASRAGA